MKSDKKRSSNHHLEEVMRNPFSAPTQIKMFSEVAALREYI